MPVEGRPAPWSTDPDFALPTVFAVAAVVLWLMAALAWWGTRRRLQVLSLGLAGALAVLVVWFVPAARLHTRTGPGPESARVRLLPESVRAIEWPATARALSRVALVADFESQGAAREDVRSISLAHGRLQTPGGPLEARRPKAPSMVTWRAEAPTALLAILSDTEFRESTGQPVRFTGQHALDLRRERILVAGALQRRSTLLAKEGTVAIDEVRTPTNDDPTIARGSLTTVLGAARTSRPLSLRLRDTRSGHPLRRLWMSTPANELTTFTMLPSFARPFEWRPLHPARARGRCLSGRARRRRPRVDGSRSRFVGEGRDDAGLHGTEARRTSMMDVILHLVRHDLRAHRHLILAWLALVVAQPLVSVLPLWSALASTGPAVSVFLTATRLLLGAVALATIVQADSPLDDRAFWRTRPIAPGTMATAKLMTARSLSPVRSLSSSSSPCSSASP